LAHAAELKVKSWKNKIIIECLIEVENSIFAVFLFYYTIIHFTNNSDISKKPYTERRLDRCV
jgi:hypothetical protein